MAQQHHAELATSLAALQGAVAEERERLATAKAWRERCRREREVAVAEGGAESSWRIVSDQRCIADAQQLRQRLAELQAEAAVLQAQLA